MLTTADYLAHLRRESQRFADCLRAADPAAPVPSCPAWSASDLLWHLTEVQLFWGSIVSDRLRDPSVAITPERPEAFDDLLAAFGQASSRLVGVLETTPPQTEVWTWAEDQTVGFVLRRQAHEALIHRLDAELVAGDVHDLAPELADDGVDEALRIVFGGAPQWAEMALDGMTGRVNSTDRGSSWRIRFGRFTGTSPNTGTAHDEDAFLVDAVKDDVVGDFDLRGTAGALDSWLWGRGRVDDLVIVGDRVAFGRLAAIVAGGVD